MRGKRCDRAREFALRRKALRRIFETSVENNFRERKHPAALDCSPRAKVFPHRQTAHRKSETAGSCRVLLKCSFPRANTYPDRLWRCRASACSATALSTAGRLGRTTSRVSKLSSARSKIGIYARFRLGIELQVRRWFYRGEPVSGACQRTIRNLFRSADLQPSRR